MQVPIRKRNAGSSGHPDGTTYVWPTDGAVIDVEPRHAHELLAIRDAGFEVAEHPGRHEAPEPDDDSNDDGPDEGGTPRRRRRTTQQ